MENIETIELTNEDKKKYIATITNSNFMKEQFSKEDCIEIGNKIIRSGLENLIKYPKVGASINLDLITNEQLINEIYNFILYKVNKINKNNTS